MLSVLGKVWDAIKFAMHVFPLVKDWIAKFKREQAERKLADAVAESKKTLDQRSIENLTRRKPD